MKSAQSSKLHKHRNFRIIISITFIAVLGVSSITPVFPLLTKEFSITPQRVGLLITTYTLPGVLLTPLFGVFADRFGRKPILVPSLFLFGIAGSACAFMEQFKWILIFRLLQGTGGASLNSINVTVLGDLYEGNTRDTAMGYNSSILSIGTALYPAIGGALALLGWRVPFLLPISAIPLGFITLFLLQSPKPQNTQTMNAYLRNALDGLKNRDIVMIFVICLATFIILYGSFISYFPFLLEHTFNANSLSIGLVMAGMSVATALSSFQLGKLSKKRSKRQLLIIAFGIFFLTLILIPIIPFYIGVIITVTIFGGAVGLTIPSLQTILAEKTDMRHRAAFMSINGMVIRLGQTIGPVLMGYMFKTTGIEGTFFMGAVIAGIIVFIIYTFFNTQNSTSKI